MGSVNKVILLGNLGKDPDMRYMENGSAKATFSLATSEVYKNKEGERITQTEWHNVVLWRGVAEIAEKYLKKGHQVYIEGKLTHRSYEDKEGNKRYVTEVVGKEMTLLSNRRENEQAAALMPEKPEKVTSEAMNQAQKEDELPF